MKRLVGPALIAVMFSCPAQSQTEPDVGDFRVCVLRESARLARGPDSANIIVDAAVIKCRPVLAAYINSAPKDSLAARQDAKDMTRDALIRMARDEALLSVVELRATK